MLKTISEIEQEHIQIREILTKLENNINDFSRDKYNLLINEFENLTKFWDSHEGKEDELFRFIRKNYHLHTGEIMIIEQHKQLRGHWKILNESIKSNNPEQVRISFDTDGRMLIDKFRKHMKYEEDFFRGLKT